MQRLSSLPNKIDSPAEIVPGTPAWERAVTQPPPGLDYDLGSDRREWYPTSRPACTRIGAGTTTLAAASCWTGSAIIATSLTGVWISTSDGPSEVEGHGDFPAANAVWNTCTKYRIDSKYRKGDSIPGGRAMTIAGGHDDIKMGTKWIGTDGWVWVDRSGFDASDAGWVKEESPTESSQGQALCVARTLPQFSRLREVAETDHHTGGDGASFGDTRAPGPDFDAGRPQTSVGSC